MCSRTLGAGCLPRIWFGSGTPREPAPSTLHDDASTSLNLLDHVRALVRATHSSRRPETRAMPWMTRAMRWHGTRHRADRMPTNPIVSPSCRTQPWSSRWLRQRTTLSFLHGSFASMAYSVSRWSASSLPCAHVPAHEQKVYAPCHSFFVVFVVLSPQYLGFTASESAKPAEPLESESGSKVVQVVQTVLGRSQKTTSGA